MQSEQHGLFKTLEDLAVQFVVDIESYFIHSKIIA